MSSGSITSWQIDGETVETVRNFILGGSKIPADGDCSHEIKKTLTPWKKSYDQPQFSSVPQSCLTLCNPMKCSMPGLPVHHLLPEFTQNHAHRVSDAIQPSHPLSPPAPPTFSHSELQGLFLMSQFFSAGGQSIMEFQLQYHSFLSGLISFRIN